MNKTQFLLGCGVVAGPLYLITGFAQAASRTGFDIRHHPLSLLSNGDLGWIQITNFILSGLLVIASAFGMKIVLRSGSFLGPLCLGLYGFGLVAAGIFVPDPAFGFPPGTSTATNAMSSNGVLHFAAGGIGFFALIAACFIFARRFASHKEKGWARYSLFTGIGFFAAFLGIASGSREIWINLAFTVAVILAWTWITLLSLRLMREMKHI